MTSARRWRADWDWTTRSSCASQVGAGATGCVWSEGGCAHSGCDAASKETRASTCDQPCCRLPHARRLCRPEPPDAHAAAAPAAVSAVRQPAGHAQVRLWRPGGRSVWWAQRLAGAAWVGAAWVGAALVHLCGAAMHMCTAGCALHQMQHVLPPRQSSLNRFTQCCRPPPAAPPPDLHAVLRAHRPAAA